MGKSVRRIIGRVALWSPTNASIWDLDLPDPAREPIARESGNLPNAQSGRAGSESLLVRGPIALPPTTFLAPGCRFGAFVHQPQLISKTRACLHMDRSSTMSFVVHPLQSESVNRLPTCQLGPSPVRRTTG